MRSREVWMHAVDLAAGPGFADVPDDVLTALIDDVTRPRQRREQVSGVRLSAGGPSSGTGPVTARGDLPALAGYVTGRHHSAGLTADGALPPPPTRL